MGAEGASFRSNIKFKLNCPRVLLGRLGWSRAISEKCMREFLAACGVRQPSCATPSKDGMLHEGATEGSRRTQVSSSAVTGDGRMQGQYAFFAHFILGLNYNVSTIWSPRTLECHYDDLVPPNAQMPVRRSGPTGHLNANTTIWSNRTLKCHYDDLVPPDAPVPLR